MATRYPSDYDNYSRVEPGISRGSRSGSAARSGSSRAGNSDRRPASRTGASTSRGGASRTGYSGQRSASGQRAPQRNTSGQRRSAGQRPPQRPSGQPRKSGGGRGRRPNRMPAFAALAAVLVIVLVLVIAKPFGRSAKDQSVSAPVALVTTPPAEAGGSFDSSVDDPNQATQEQAQASASDSLADQLADEDFEVASLSAEEMAQVSDLSITAGLPEEWLNVLLLGTDERVLGDSSRTDAMIICSINKNTGEVKLTSIMRDLAVELDDIGKYNGTYRINAANFFGGPNLAIKTVNEYFNMNIQYYVMVNYFGFQKIAQRLGGIDIDITEAEKDKINEMVYEQARFAYKSGVDESDQENVYLETYGENTHLNGRMTLAYARIRKLTGGDAMRTERQRIVLQKLLEKVKGLDPMTMAALATDMIGQVKTNLPLEDIVNLALQVVGNGINGVKDLRLPVSGTYKEESRNDQSMLYDCDWQANALALYNFIYEN